MKQFSLALITVIFPAMLASCGAGFTSVPKDEVPSNKLEKAKDTHIVRKLDMKCWPLADFIMQVAKPGKYAHVKQNVDKRSKSGATIGTIDIFVSKKGVMITRSRIRKNDEGLGYIESCIIAQFDGVSN